MSDAVPRQKTIDAEQFSEKEAPRGWYQEVLISSEWAHSAVKERGGLTTGDWILDSKWIGYSIVVGCLLAYLTRAKVIKKSKETVNYR